jgi:hypothetical protein
MLGSQPKPHLPFLHIFLHFIHLLQLYVQSRNKICHKIHHTTYMINFLTYANTKINTSTKQTTTDTHNQREPRCSFTSSDMRTVRAGLRTQPRQTQR